MRRLVPPLRPLLKSRLIHRSPFKQILRFALVAGSLVATYRIYIFYTNENIFAIGNSLTLDTRPRHLEGNISYHIYCNKNLKDIYNDPDGHCVNSSTPWPKALNRKQYDWLIVQPFSGTTLEEDVQTISEWLEQQPDADLIIHSGWTTFEKFPSTYTAGNPDNQMRISPEYISALTSQLQQLDPSRRIRHSRVNDLLYSIWQDTQAEIGPFNDLSDLARDDIHMELDIGRYIAHNALRISLGQEISDRDFDIDPAVKEYLDEKLMSLPTYDNE